MEQDLRLWEQARTINTAQNLLKRYIFRRLGSSNPCLSPSLTPQQIYMLMAVRQHGSTTLKQLAESLGVKPPAVSLMLDRLVETGALSREQNPADRREVIIRLTPDMEARVDEIEGFMLTATVEILERMGLEDAERWRNVCLRLQEVLRDGELEPPQGQEDA